jgi:acetyl esterase/lipase
VLVLLVAAACAGGNDEAAGSEQTAAIPDRAPTTSATTTIETTDAPVPAAATTEPDPAIEASTAPTTESPSPRWAATDVEGCVCSDGSPVDIYERVADPTRVVLYFEGGGACFSAETCDPDGSPTYSVNKRGLTARTLERLGGYFDDDNPDNPLASHSFVYVPYCTGDVHEGNTTYDYGNGVVIEHRGYANALKALEYLVASYPDAQQVVVTGESAGSVPTALFGAMAADALPAAAVVTFGDSSGAYPDVDPVTQLIGGLWGFPSGVPPWPELAGLAVEQWSFPEQVIHAGLHAPRVRFGRFDHAFDRVQATYGALAGVGADELVTLIDENERRIEAEGVALATFVAPGDSHTISSTAELYELEVDGVRLIDWLASLINDPAPPPDVHCTECEDG